MFVDLERIAARREISNPVVREEPQPGRPVRTVAFHVARAGGATREPRLAVYQIPVHKGMTVLDALLWIKEREDPSLAFRSSCRMGICGSCGMLINGEPRLACETQIEDLATDVVEIAPLPNFPVVRDVVTDFDDFFAHHRRIRPYLVRPENHEPGPVREELRQSEQERLEYYQFAMCIMCGLCDAACPVVALDREFLGPQALAQAYRFSADSRDRGAAERERNVDTIHGCWRCELAGSCSAVCPKGVDPGLAVQLLKRSVVRRRIVGR